MKAGRSVLILVASLFAVLLAVSAGSAHPPSSLDLAYSADEGILTISIAHAVGDVSTHYIKSVNVTVDGRQAADLFYVRQGEKNGEKILVTIGWLEKGSQLSVTVKCNRFGDLEKKLVL